jgi:two-component system NtrC family sensor kinase
MPISSSAHRKSVRYPCAGGLSREGYVKDNGVLQQPLELLREELRLHRRAMDYTSCGIVIADARLEDLPLIYINESFETISGYSADEVLGRNCRFLQRDDRDQPAVQILRDAIRKRESCKVILRNYRKDGTLFWNELFMSPIFDESGELTHFVGIQTDVSERVAAEEALQRQRVELARALDELRDAQTMLIHAEKMNALGQMMAGIAHEINNPLSYVYSNIHSLRGTITDVFDAYNRLEALIQAEAAALAESAAKIRSDADLDFVFADVGDLLHASLEGLGRVKRIVQALRTFSRLDEAEKKLADLHEAIESTLIIARRTLGTKIRVVLELDNLPEIVCYPAELNQVFLNIILNAGQAMPEGGVLTIRGRDLGDRVLLEFSDTGIGMTPEVKAKIFDPFFTTKRVGEGMGLGLSIAYKIITDHHQGTISVESAPGAGATFTITLPKVLR